jgi:hypothetical protein
MSDFWTFGPTAAAMFLRARGFSPREAERLVRLKLRFERGDSHELTPTRRFLAHLLFLRWLAQQGRFDDGESTRSVDGERRAA